MLSFSFLVPNPICQGKCNVSRIYDGRRVVLLFSSEGTFRPRKGGGAMVTYAELYSLLTLIVAIIALVTNITKKK